MASRPAFITAILCCSLSALEALRRLGFPASDVSADRAMAPTPGAIIDDLALPSLPTGPDHLCFCLPYFSASLDL